MYIHEREHWTDFRWDSGRVAAVVEEVGRRQGLLIGRLRDVGFDERLRAVAENMVEDVASSSEIEGIRLNTDELRSSIAHRLGLEQVRYTAPSHYIDSVVGVMLAAVGDPWQELTDERLCAWQSAFFPFGVSEGSRIEVGRYRTHAEHIVSGVLGRERVHYVAPAPERVGEEMSRFLRWFNARGEDASVVRSAVAHLWFVAIHPFEDGNGRLARILSDMLLARADGSEGRLYNVAAQINKHKRQYYDILERTTTGDGDLTEWILWHARMLLAALADAEAMVSVVLSKSFFWRRVAAVPLSERQATVLNLFLDGYEAKITTKTWARLARCSKDTALRDIQQLAARGILREDVPGAKRPSYSIVYTDADLVPLFSDVRVVSEGNEYFLTAVCRGVRPVRERVSELDAERYAAGDLPLASLLGKYASFIAQ